MAPAAQHSSCSIMTTLKRSSLPAILLVGAAVGLALFYFVSPGYFVSEQELHWIQRVKEINDKHAWTSKNCPKLMSLLIELCPCIANINPQQSVDDIEDSFVECVSTCISDDDLNNMNMTAGYDYKEEDYKDDDYPDEESPEKDGASKSPAAASSAKKPSRPAGAGARARPASAPSAASAGNKEDAKNEPGKSRRRR